MQTDTTSQETPLEVLLKDVTDEELQAALEEGDLIITHALAVKEKIRAELDSRDPNKPVQLELF